MKLYRVISEAEYDDVLLRNGFYLARNTLEAKEFWLSEVACRSFLTEMRLKAFTPPYSRMLILEVSDRLDEVPHLRMELDGRDALIIDREALALFNNIITYEAVDL